MEFGWNLLLRIFLGLLWLTNGLFCKLLNRVPRHQQIVARVVGHEWAPFFTRLIGVLEILLAIWILSRWKPRSAAVVQMVAIAAMNIIEINVADDILLFGPFNIVLAGALIFIIYLHAFVIEDQHRQTMQRL